MKQRSSAGLRLTIKKVPTSESSLNREVLLGAFDVIGMM